MKKIFMTLAVLFCCVMAVMADQVNQDEAKARAEQKAKEADENPKDGKKQLAASYAFLGDTTGLDKDHDRALQYAERAMSIANEQTVLQDTLKGLACHQLFVIYSIKGDQENALNYMKMAADAFQDEFGSNNPMTIGHKFIYGYSLMGFDPFRAAASLLDAFCTNDALPRDKCIENMAVANIAQEIVIEFLIAAATNRFRYALPVIIYKDKPCLLLQTKNWNVERPLVGWMTQSLLNNDGNESQETEHAPGILCEMETQRCFVIPEDDRKNNQISATFIYRVENPRMLETRNGSSYILFFSEQEHAKILNNFREFKASLKK